MAVDFLSKLRELRESPDRRRSDHQQRVDHFMLLANQDVPVRPIEPSEQVRKLRASLILEECLETIKKGLGVDVYINPQEVQDENQNPIDITDNQFTKNGMQGFDFCIARPFDMIETVDGCTDIAVVTTGTLTACGVNDVDVQLETDENNLAKFGPGHSWREDGKLIKSPDHQSPNFVPILVGQGWQN